jgi:hypothetical protein
MQVSLNCLHKSPVLFQHPLSSIPKIPTKNRNSKDDLSTKEKEASVNYITKKMRLDEEKHILEIAKLKSEINVNLLRAHLLNKELEGILLISTISVTQ